MLCFTYTCCSDYQCYKYRISNEFSFHTMYYETSCVFYTPEPLARGYKTHEFHNTSYGMKIHLRFFLSHELTRNEQIITWNRPFPQIGTDDAMVAIALLEQVRIVQWYLSAKKSTFPWCWNSKTLRRAWFDVIPKANLPFDSLRIFMNA